MNFKNCLFSLVVVAAALQTASASNVETEVIVQTHTKSVADVTITETVTCTTDASTVQTSTTTVKSTTTSTHAASTVYSTVYVEPTGSADDGEDCDDGLPSNYNYTSSGLSFNSQLGSTMSTILISSVVVGSAFFAI